MASDRPHRYAARLSGAGAARSGDAESYPYSGHLFVFRGRRGDLIKIIWHDGQGACLFSKRLEQGRFIWPKLENGAVTISPAQLAYMLEGIDWRAPQKTYRPQVAG